MITLGLFSSIGPLEIGILLLVGLLLFGRRLPEVGRGLGRSITEFKRGLKDVTEDVDETATEVRKLDETPAPPAGAIPAADTATAAAPAQPAADRADGSSQP